MRKVIYAICESAKNKYKNMLFEKSAKQLITDGEYTTFLSDVESVLLSMDKGMQAIVFYDNRDDIEVRFYGYNRMYSNEEEFSRVNDKNSMMKYAKDVLGHWNSLKKYDNVFAGAYWTAKVNVEGAGIIETGPYIAMCFSASKVCDNNL